MECSLANAPFDPASELARFSGLVDGCGAIASFSGVARPLSKQGSEISAMLLESHPRLTLLSMEDIAEGACKKFEIQSLRIVHRHGLIAPGETIVFVAAASAHRRAALDAVDYLMDRLKTEAVFWKREDTSAGSSWVEPTDEDYADRERWDHSPRN